MGTRKTLLASLIWLTAFATLIAGVPLGYCPCAARSTPLQLEQAAACCCCSGENAGARAADAPRCACCQGTASKANTGQGCAGCACRMSVPHLPAALIGAQARKAGGESETLPQTLGTVTYCFLPPAPAAPRTCHLPGSASRSLPPPVDKVIAHAHFVI